MKIHHLMMLLSTIPDLEILALDSCECFDSNKTYVKKRLLFKVAVELGKLSHMTAAIKDVDDETLINLHEMCVNEVRKINGIIDYEDAVEYQQN